jgi:hypothetical protein
MNSRCDLVAGARVCFSRDDQPMTDRIAHPVWQTSAGGAFAASRGVVSSPQKPIVTNGSDSFATAAGY